MEYNIAIASILAIGLACIKLYGMVVQAYQNMLHRSAEALSVYMLIMSSISASSQLLYLYFLSLPLLFRLLIIPQILLVLIFMYQRYYYTRDNNIQKTIIMSSIGVGFLIVLLLFVAYVISFTVSGNIAGWILVGTGFILKLPQIVHIYQRKSVEGYSLNYLASDIIANAISMFITLSFQLPIQSLLRDIRSLFFLSIIGLQFWWYSHSIK